MASDILIVDDEADIRDLVAGILEDEGYAPRTARDSDSALAEIANRRPHLVFLDIWLQGSRLDGLALRIGGGTVTLTGRLDGNGGFSALPGVIGAGGAFTLDLGEDADADLSLQMPDPVRGIQTATRKTLPLA